MILFCYKKICNFILLESISELEKVEDMMRDNRKELVIGKWNDWNSNLGDRDWDYQMEICESMLEMVVRLAPGKVSG